MNFSVKKSINRLVLLLLVIVAGPALGSGGDWKMGPFGPYWDDNSWPEFTPMYWMEEFMNRLDDDDDEIQIWMLRNQFPGQYSGAWPGTGLQGLYPQDSWQPHEWTGSRAQSRDRAYAASHSKAPGGNTYIIGENNPIPDASENDSGPLPYLTPEEFARMPIDLQREYKRAFNKEYKIVAKPKPKTQRRPLPRLTQQEFARMPADLQREYTAAFDREYGNTYRRSPGSQQRRPLPNMTSEEFARMPAELRREYSRAFAREYYGPSSSSAYRESRPAHERGRQRLPDLTPEEFTSMPAELQRDYKRAFDREYAEYRARQANLARQRRSYPEDRR